MLEAGSALVDITPNKPVYLGGYGAGPVRRCNQLSSQIFARSLVLREGERSVAFSIIDTQGLPYQSRRDWFGFRSIQDEARSRIPGLDLVFGASSHSHCSPDSTGLWGGLEDDYAETLVEGAVSALVEASSTAAPCEIFFGSVDTEGLLRSQVRSAPHNRVEKRAFVVEARSPSKGPVGRLIVFAAHATVASGNHLTSDWPGCLAASLEEDPGGTTLVIPGCIGRTQPKFRGDGSQAAVREYSRRVEEYIRPLLEHLEPLKSSPKSEPFLDCAEKIVEHPVRNLALLAAAGALGRFEVGTRGVISTSAPTVSKVVRLGNLYFFGFPGEAYPNLQWALEAEMLSQGAQTHPIACSLVGDQIGYLIYPSSSYMALALRSAWNDNALLCAAPGIGERLLETALGLSASLPGPARPRRPDGEFRASRVSPAWDAAGIPGSAVAMALALAGTAGYAAASLSKRVARAAGELAAPRSTALAASLRTGRRW